MGNLAIDERAGNDADDFAIHPQHGIGQHSHESDARPTVDDAQPALNRRTRELSRGRGVYL
jgi:hypothetical protein